jgi:alkaline phosphatase
MPVSGFSKTFSLDDYITDSAAGGTALSAGKKTRNGVLAEDTLGNKMKTILEIAEENGLKTGLVSTSTITHATPASFIAHSSSRNNYEDIAKAFLDTDIDVFIGGGYLNFSARKDSLNLIDSLEIRGYQIARSMEEVEQVKQGKLAALLADGHMPSIINGRGNMLPQATEAAINLLSDSDKGFFLMVEGSQIDWGGHANNQEYVVTETLDFDQALGKALDFARADGNTLVIVTADHETGGMSLTGGDLNTKTIISAFSTGGHTAVMVPVFSYGPGAIEFSGIMDNTMIFHKMLELYNFSNDR